jgi:hypothetical protein
MQDVDFPKKNFAPVLTADMVHGTLLVLGYSEQEIRG